MTAPVLIFGWGNPSRGDDALGPLVVDWLTAQRDMRQDWPKLDVLTDFQLQVEHGLDLAGRQRVLFVDATLSVGDGGFTVTPLQAIRDDSLSTHAASAAGVMAVYEQITGQTAPPCWQMAIRGEDFALGAPLSDRAATHLRLALHWIDDWLRGAGA